MRAAVESISAGQKFRRMSLLRRGHFPNTIRLRPITEITLDQDGIALTRGSRQYGYKWAEIKSARILSEESFKGYGRAASGKFIKRTFVLESADGGRFTFDVSEDFPDFENSGELLKSLREYLTIIESTIKQFNYPLWMAVAIVILLVGVALKKFGL